MTGTRAHTSSTMSIVFSGGGEEKGSAFCELSGPRWCQDVKRRRLETCLTMGCLLSRRQAVIHEAGAAARRVKTEREREHEASW